MFRRLPEIQFDSIAVTIDSRPVLGRSGDSVAATLLANCINQCRFTPVSGAPRAPYCMMGVCFECLVTVDGIGNRQGCMIPIREGMRVETQRGKRDVTQ